MQDFAKQSISDYHLSNIKEETKSKRTPTGGDKNFKLVGMMIVSMAAAWLLDTIVGLLFFYPHLTFIDLFLLEIPAAALYTRVVTSITALCGVTLFLGATDVKSLDRALVSSSKWFSATMKSIGAALLAIDRNGHIIFINPAAQALTGWSLKQAIGEDLKNVCHVLDIDSRLSYDIRDRLRKLMVDGEPFSIDMPLLLQASDGREPMITCKANPIINEDQSITGAVIVLYDVTEIKKKEDAVIRLATVVEQADDAVLITDVDGIIDYVNPSFERLTELDKGAVIGTHVNTHRSPVLSDDFYRNLKETIFAGGVWRGEYSIIKNNGVECRLETKCSLIRDRLGKTINYVSIGRDISREAELHRRLEQAKKMESLGRLAGGVAHDFNNLLTVITGYSQIIRKKIDMASPIYDHLDKILSASDRSKGLIKQLLAFSGKDVLKPRIIDISDAVGKLEEMLKRLMRNDTDFRCDLQADIGAVRADANQFDQIILNLVANAADAVSENGKIILKTRNVTLESPAELRGLDIASGAYVEIAVTDNGSGIDAETLSHIFEPFYTTKDEGKGTGLGLSIVYGAVKDLGGDIRVRSAVGEGTTFEIYLPVIASLSKPEPALNLSESTTTSGDETILAVDDVEEILDLVGSILRDSGYHVMLAKSSREALDIIGRYDGEINLLITDLIMPEIDGFKLAELLAAKRPLTKTLYMSGILDRTKVDGNFSAIRSVFLEKPFAAETLLAKVRDILDYSESA